MAIKGSKSHGQDTQSKVRRVVVAILDYADGAVSDARKSKPMVCQWADDGRLVVNDALVNTILHRVNADKDLADLSAEDVKRSFGDLAALQILTDRRGSKTQGVSLWQFDLKFQTKERQAVLAEFDRLWEVQWPIQSAVSTKSMPGASGKSGLKPGAPRPRVRLPENFVARPEALAAVKGRLLRESEQTLVVSAIAGLGGLGKSVLATAIVLDADVQERFADGILWVTLGQNPDLLREVGEWIRELDKSRESFSATTLESASGYLHNLLAEKRVLLVVDDVWNADHADCFRVGGAGCRVLVTTREAQFDGIEPYELDLMTEDEAIELVRRKLGAQWDAGQADAVRQFARVVGYLPLALDLSVTLVRDGVSWGELQAEFEDERKAVALGLLDASEAFEHLPEEKQRKYSLKACFNLSLKRLNPDQRRRFAWLGVLPEDVRVDARMVGTLWGVSAVMAKRGLIELFRRSFLTSAGESIEGYALYRVHDLMHDTARGLIEGGELGVEGLAGAHGAFVDRYGAIDYGNKLCGLVNDGYIHRHLTWHLVMTGREDAVHELLGASDGQGRNAWFEACEEIGEPAVFVQDVKRGWELAEGMYDRENEVSVVAGVDFSRGRLQQRQQDCQVEWELLQRKVARLRRELAIETGVAVKFQLEQQIQAVETQLLALDTELENLESQLSGKQAAGVSQVSAEDRMMRAIALQGRYALITGTLVSLIEAFVPELLSATVKYDFWSFDRAWSYVDMFQSETLVATAIELLSSYASSIQLQTIARKAYSLQSDFSQAQALLGIAKIDSNYIKDALPAILSISDDRVYWKASYLRDLSLIHQEYVSIAIDTARAISVHECSRYEILCDLIPHARNGLDDFVQEAQNLENKLHRSFILVGLSYHFPDLLQEASDLIGKDNDENNSHTRAVALIKMSKIDFKYLHEALENINIVMNQE